MKISLNVSDGRATLILSAENEFERKTVANLNTLPVREVEIQVSESNYWNDPPRSAGMTVTFSTNPPTPTENPIP